uniref:L-amino-acid oxidase n=1 Tax=Varanus komodoensis TaxID=61221 RepID=A0A8D2IU36_VARKO
WVPSLPGRGSPCGWRDPQGRGRPPSERALTRHLSWAAARKAAWKGKMREVEVGGHPVLLLRDHLRFLAVGSRCPHAGAPLCKGYFKGGRLRCPWHGACFSTETGDIEEYPTLDCLPAFQVSTSPDLESGRRVKPMSKRCQLNPQTVLLLGAGPAALTCAETLRQEGFTGRVILATAEEHLPYDRTKLSKEMDAKAERLYLRPRSFLDAFGIEVWMRKEVGGGRGAGMNRGASAPLVHSPRQLQCPGSALQNVCVLLTPEDAGRILRLSTGKRAVIVGASFIGMEVAASLSGRAASIHVVERDPLPYCAALGEQVGSVAMKVRSPRCLARDRPAWSCKWTRGILGLGSGGRPTGQGQGPPASPPVPLWTSRLFSPQGMRTSSPSVFAAGDVTSFPVALLEGKSAPIRHWQVAQAHGHVAALSILQKPRELHTVPYFWTKLRGKSIRYAGCGIGYTETVLKGDLDQERFLLFYVRDGTVTAAASLNFDPMVSVVAEALYAGRPIRKEEGRGPDSKFLPGPGSDPAVSG